MRELNECTAEVFRRGEKRIRERRRNRNRVLAVCIPICLIAAAWSVKGLPTVMLDRETSDYAQMVGDVNGSFFCPYTAVEIQEVGLFPEEHYGKMTDRLAVAEMFRAIHSLFADAGTNDGNISENFQASESFPADADNVDHFPTESTSKYTITFTTEEGSQAVYHLSENTLVNVSTNETIFLSDAQADGLMAVLGLAE